MRGDSNNMTSDSQPTSSEQQNNVAVLLSSDTTTTDNGDDDNSNDNDKLADTAKTTDDCSNESDGGCLGTKVVIDAEPEEKEMIGDYTVEYLLQRVKAKVENRVKDWESYKNNAIQPPIFTRDEITIGKELGEGGFFKVYEIEKITLRNDGDDDSETEIDHDDRSMELGVVQNRRYMQKKCLRTSKRGKKVDCRYAIKTMKKSALNDPGLFVNTLVDMAIEAKYVPF
jgi:hypothetical protein